MVRLLQDISGESGQLPKSVRLPSITHRKFLGLGGEAAIWAGRLGKRRVVSRETYLSSAMNGGWSSDEGRLTLKVYTVLSHP